MEAARVILVDLTCRFNIDYIEVDVGDIQQLALALDAFRARAGDGTTAAPSPSTPAPSTEIDTHDLQTKDCPRCHKPYVRMLDGRCICTVIEPSTPTNATREGEEEDRSEDFLGTPYYGFYREAHGVVADQGDVTGSWKHVEPVFDALCRIYNASSSRRPAEAKAEAWAVLNSQGEIVDVYAQEVAMRAYAARLNATDEVCRPFTVRALTWLGGA